MIDSNNKSKEKRMKETELRLDKIESKLRYRLKRTEEAMIEAKQIATKLDELEKQ